MFFTRIGWVFALIVGAYGVFDLAWTVGHQGPVYAESMSQQGVEDGAEMGRILAKVGWFEDIADALRIIGFSIVIGILSEIGKSVSSRRFE